jgi:sulfur-carrier protein adenylyltransferase/sulfurtransferase
MLNEKEIVRYSRHILLSEIGRVGQEKLKNARVLVVGAGGLGCPVLMYLTAAGVGKIGIIDFDKVDETNLQRQVLFDVRDIGKQKASIAREKLVQQNPHIEILDVNLKLATANALYLFSDYDVIVDGTDNFSTRYLVNDACVLLGKTLVSGSVFKFQGQVSVFNYRGENENFGPTYRCLFPSPPPAGSTPSCSEIGVMGVLPGIIGTLMANETIKIITGVGEILSGKILLFDSLNINFQTIEIERNPEIIKYMPQNEEAFKQMDYESFCGVDASSSAIKEIAAEELLALLSVPANIQVLDVREIQEHPQVPALSALNIPLGDIEKQVSLIHRDKQVVVFCRGGTRSRKAIELLSSKHNFDNLYNLKGGVMEWIKICNKKQNV